MSTQKSRVSLDRVDLGALEALGVNTFKHLFEYLKARGFFPDHFHVTLLVPVPEQLASSMPNQLLVLSGNVGEPLIVVSEMVRHLNISGGQAFWGDDEGRRYNAFDTPLSGLHQVIADAAHSR